MPKSVQRSRKGSALLDMRAVAAKAKVSIATVSRTINRLPTVNAKMAKRVWAAIDELGYVPNTQARALGSGRSGMIGLVVSEITNPFFPELIQSFEDAAIENGYEILIGSTNYDPRRMELCIRRLLERKAEGVAILTFGIEQPLFEQLADRNIPLVFVDVGPDRPGVSVLKINYDHGIRQGVQHLAALGHRKIGFISGPLALHSAQSRSRAFLKALGECGILARPEWQAEGNHTFEGGIPCMERILGGSDRPTAVMCSNDMTALGALHVAHRLGLRVPADISVVGFDNIQMARVMIPPLTSVQMSPIDIANAAVKALKAHIEGDNPQREYKIDTHLVVRESTDFPPGAMSDLKPSRRDQRDLPASSGRR